MTGERTRTDRQRRSPTVSVSLADRGQTTQDFAVGIGVFILAIAFVFSFMPTMLTPYETSIGGAETAQADRISDRVVHNLSAEYDEPNAINASEFEAAYIQDHENLSNRLGVEERGGGVAGVNVRLEHLNGTEIDDWSTDPEYRNQSAASSARIVSISEGSPDCEPTCRLVVRVW